MRWLCLAAIQGDVVELEYAHRVGDQQNLHHPAFDLFQKPLAKGIQGVESYDVAEFVRTLRNHGVTPHVTQKKVGSAIDGRTTRHAGYAVSLKKRKRLEEIFSWAKTVGGLRKAEFIGLAKVKAQTVFTLAAYNLTRMATIFGWRLNTV